MPQTSSRLSIEAEEELSRHPCYSEEAHRFLLGCTSRLLPPVTFNVITATENSIV